MSDTLRHARAARRDAVLSAILSGSTVEQAAEANGVTTRSVYTYLRDPDVRRRIQQQRDDTAEVTAAALTRMTLEAVGTLYALMTSPLTTQANRIRAAGLLLSEARGWADTDLSARIAAVEAAIAESTPEPMQPLRSA